MIVADSGVDRSLPRVSDKTIPPARNFLMQDRVGGHDMTDSILEPMLNVLLGEVLASRR